jgi:hypothetical protein
MIMQPGRRPIMSRRPVAGSKEERMAVGRARPRTLLAVAVMTAAAIGFASVPTMAAAKSKPVWLCKPGKKHNPCEPGLKTTLISPSGEELGVKNVKAEKHPKVDCFYVYPTVSDQDGPNANLHIDPEERSIALYQAARYSQECRVFAPMYRQVTLSGIGQPVTHHESQVAYSSALKAWKTYLKKYNHGRGVVLIGHSQGSFVLRQLISKQIDPKPALRRQLVSAVLLGGNVTVKKGRGVGGDFQHIRACRSNDQLHCVVAFSTFNAPAPADAIFGRTTAPGLRVLCTNPAALAGGQAKLKTVLPSEPFAPGTTIGVATTLIGFPQVHAATPWIEADGAYSGACSSADGANVLELTDEPGAPHLNTVPDATWGLHLTDANIALGNLSNLVRGQAKVYAAKHG